MPPGATTGGGLAFLLRPPETWDVPLRSLSMLCALAVTLTLAAEVCAIQVPVQRPSPSELRVRVGSVLEKAAVTAPRVSGVPQSSTMRSSTGEGHPVVRLNPAPSDVKTGRSLDAVQPAGRAPGAEGRVVPPGE